MDDDFSEFFQIFPKLFQDIPTCSQFDKSKSYQVRNVLIPSYIISHIIYDTPIFLQAKSSLMAINPHSLHWLVVASGRTRRLVISCVFCVKWVRWGVGGWGGMLTFIGLAHLHDATLLHVLFNLHNYVMLRYCDATLTGVGGWVGDVNVHWHWRNHQKKEFCRLLTDINSTKLSKIAGTQQIDRQWLSLKKLEFPIFTEK